MEEQFEINLGKDFDIREGITKYILDKGWEAAYIMGAIGSVKECQFTTPISNELPLKFASIPCTLAGEVLSFTGEVMKRELMDASLEAAYPDKTCPLFVHIHASIAVSGGHVYGGGLKGGKTLRALRIFIKPLGH